MSRRSTSGGGRSRLPRLSSLAAAVALGSLLPAGVAVGGSGTSVTARLTVASPQEGRRVSGSLLDLGGSDDRYLTVEAAFDGKKHRTATLIGAVSPHRTVSRLDLTIESGVARGGDAKFVVSMFDFDQGDWKRLGSYKAGDDVAEGLDGVKDPDRFVHDFSGFVWIRLATALPKSKAREGSIVRIDHVKVEVTP